ncbi:MAG: hypothetical protein GY773_21705, partial [Actinomycetia bacterium]|nr:hypothetical protein [Actinomycetes bacterium]
MAHIPFINRFFGAKPVKESDEARAHRLALINDLTFEVVPLKSLEAAEEALPAGAKVSVTASPNKGIEVTQEISERLIARGFDVIPHVSARLVRDQTHTKELAEWFHSNGVSRIFLVGGDSEEPGQYFDSVEFLTDLLDTDHGLTTIGFTAYPDGHALIDNEKIHQALHDKQRLLTEAGVEGYCSTQMCFDPNPVSRWLRASRSDGLTMPVHLGLSGVVDRTKLLTMGARLGIGQSLSYLRKNRRAIASMMTTANYDPNDLLLPLSQDLLELGVEGLHVFTF